MNPDTGEIREFLEARGRLETPVPAGWIVLSEEEARTLRAMDPDKRIEHFIKVLRRFDKCKACGCFLKNHSATAFKHCAKTELGQFGAENLWQYELTDAEVDAELERTKNEPVDQVSLERMKALFNAKVEAAKLAEQLETSASTANARDAGTSAIG